MCVKCGINNCGGCAGKTSNVLLSGDTVYDGLDFNCTDNFSFTTGDSLNSIIDILANQICANANDAFVHYLGEEFGGGIIYYLYKDSLGVERGLIVNKNESNEVWQATGTVTGATRTEDGAYNTNLMTNSDAATYVNSLTDGNFTDWYLPSIDELGILWANRFFVNKTLRAGAFTLLSYSATYWSSQEFSQTGAISYIFLSGIGFNDTKSNSKVSRGIRSF